MTHISAQLSLSVKSDYSPVFSQYCFNFLDNLPAFPLKIDTPPLPKQISQFHEIKSFAVSICEFRLPR